MRTRISVKMVKNKHNILKIENDFFLEVDYGSWSGEKISTLANDPLWSIVQKQPSNAKFQDGESLLNMSQRANKGFESMIQSHK